MIGVLAIEMRMLIPAGYMAKRIAASPGSLGPCVADIYSASSCVSEEFADYIQYWKHNGYWLFDSPEIIRALASEHSIALEGMHLFYYEVYPLQFDGEQWVRFSPEPSFPTDVQVPPTKQLEGFDVVTFFAGNSHECSPLSCNSLAKDLPTNSHCLFESFETAKESLDTGRFTNCEPGPYRIFAVHSVPWPHSPKPKRLERRAQMS